MTYEEYAAKCRELSEAATPGPWEPKNKGKYALHGAPDGPESWQQTLVCQARANQKYRHPTKDEANIALIAHNRTSADVWREAFLELAASPYIRSLYSERPYLVTNAFQRAYAKVTGGE